MGMVEDIDSQKGTMGIACKHSDMPFTSRGITPDICMNPCAIPSRMTIGQLIEAVIGKVAAIEGTEADGTPFSKIDIESVKNKLEALGEDRNGCEYLYNGMTGVKMKSKIFICPTYYNRLKHQVEDKMHCLTMDHEVSTIDGFKSFNNLTMDDMIMVLNNGEIKYEKPLELLHYPNFEGKLYHVKNNDVDLLVTEKHRMYVKQNDKFELIEVNKLSGKVYYCNYDITSNPLINHNNDVTIIESKEAVFCLTVPSEVFLVKRNDKMTWTGNSRSIGPKTLLTRQPPDRA